MYKAIWLNSFANRDAKLPYFAIQDASQQEELATDTCEYQVMTSSTWKHP